MKTTGGLKARENENTALEQKKQDMLHTINRMMPQIKNALPSVVKPERFVRIVLTAFSSTPGLWKCTPNSFLGAMMQTAQLGLEPNTPTGQAYLIPYKVTRGTENWYVCQFQLGYKGLLTLAYRTGEFQSIEAHEVYEHDTFEYELGLNPKLKHIPAMKNRGEVIAYYAVYHLKNGGYGFEVASKNDMETFAGKHSQSYKGKNKSGPWASDFDAMAKKTMIKRVLKYAPISAELMSDIAADETVKEPKKEEELKNIIDLAPEDVTVENTAEEKPETPEPEGEPDPAEPMTDIPREVDPQTGEVLFK